MASTLAETAGAFQLLGEPTRVRLLALLAEKELTVADLTAITELPQSTVSTHLARLREAALVRDRKLGNATLYSLDEDAMPEGARRLWTLLRAEVQDGALERDRRRLEQRGAQGWPDALAGQMERHYSPGRTWESLARGLIGLVELGDVLDAGSGDGAIAQLLAPRARSFTLVDRRERMIAAARDRLAGARGVAARVADLQELPLADASFDVALCFNVLTEVERPERALAEIARVLRPEGKLVVTVLDAHEHAEVAASYGHVHAGFAPAALRRLLGRAGFDVEECRVASQEKRPPRFRVVTAWGRKAGKRRT